MTKQEALRVLEEIKQFPYHGKIVWDAINMAIEALEQEPIIHCKDCEHAKPFLKRYHCKKLDEDWEISFEANHYCSFAERMESDGE